jgi:hypothetical protein
LKEQAELRSIGDPAAANVNRIRQPKRSGLHHILVAVWGMKNLPPQIQQIPH